MENELKELKDRDLLEIQGMISEAQRAWRVEEDPGLKQLKRREVLKLIDHYNERVGFHAYRRNL